MQSKKIKGEIIEAGYIAIKELVKVAGEAIVGNDSQDDLSADKLKSAAATKKLAIFDAFEILSRIESEENILNEVPEEKKEKKAFAGFAEGRSKSK